MAPKRSLDGLRPWRKLLHALAGVLAAAGLTYLPLSRAQATAILAAVFVVLLTIDWVRLRSPRANEAFLRAFSGVVSSREAEGMATSTWYALGIGLSVALFPRPEAVSGILVLGLADPAAGYVGQRWGRRPFLGGSVLGTVTFVGVAAAVLGIRHPPAAALVAAVVAAVVERGSGPLDDNLVVPVTTAATLFGMQALL